MIELKHISKIFPTADGEFQALTDVSLTIPTGDIFGIVGMSGAGKSTLVRCINLLERPTMGQVLIDGLLDESGKAVDLCTLSPAQLRKARRGISMIFQQFNLLMQRTCLDNICFPMEIAGVSKAKARERAREPPILRFCSVTRPPPPWTPPPPGASCGSFRTSTAAWASPWWSSPMRWRWWRRSAPMWPFWSTATW